MVIAVIQQQRQQQRQQYSSSSTAPLSFSLGICHTGNGALFQKRYLSHWKVWNACNANGKRTYPAPLYSTSAASQLMFPWKMMTAGGSISRLWNSPRQIWPSTWYILQSTFVFSPLWSRSEVASSLFSSGSSKSSFCCANREAVEDVTTLYSVVMFENWLGACWETIFGSDEPQ